MEDYLEEIADGLAGIFIVTESPDGDSLELTPSSDDKVSYYKAIYKEGDTFYVTATDEIFSNHEYSYSTDDVNELIDFLSHQAIDKSELSAEDLEDLDECYNQAGSIAKDGIEIDGVKGTIHNSGLHEDYDEEAEVEENPHSYDLFLKFAKYHKDELQDTDDLWDMQDRILVMSDEDVLKECPEGFTLQEVREMMDYLEHGFEANAFGKLWNQVHESCNKTEGFNSMAEDYVKRILEEMFEEEEFDIYDEDRVVKDVIQIMKQDGVLMERPSKELKQLIKDLFEERLEKDILGEKKLDEDTDKDKIYKIVADLYYDGNYNFEEEEDQVVNEVIKEMNIAEADNNLKQQIKDAIHERVNMEKVNENKNLNEAETGVDKAVKAIQQYMDNKGNLDVNWLTDNIMLDVKNTKFLYDKLRNTRIRNHSVAYEGLVYTLGNDNDLTFTSRQIQSAFKKLGLDYKEVLKPAIKEVDDYRAEMSTEEKVEDINDKFLGESEKLVEDITPEEVLELLIPNESDVQPEEIPQEVVVGVPTEEPGCPECTDVQPESGLLKLAKYLISAEASIKGLHHNLIGGEWFSNHEKLGDYAYNIGTFQDDVIEQLIMLGGTEPSVEEAIKEYPTVAIQPRNKQESFAQLKMILDTIVSLIDGAKEGLAQDIVSKLEEYQNSIRKESDYKVVRNLQEDYVLVSNKEIKNKLKLESKIEDVKKEAHDEAVKTGYDQYVYRLGEDIFFSDAKPTDTRLVNRGILTLGRYRVGIENAKPVATWFEESKSTSKNRMVIKEEKDNELLIKDLNPEHNSTSQEEINDKAKYNHNELNVPGTPLGKDVESVATSSTIAESKATVINNLKNYLQNNKIKPDDIDSIEKYLHDNHLGIVTEVPNKIFKVASFGKDGSKEVIGKVTYNTQGNWNYITESKEVPENEKVAGEDYEVLTLDEYKKEFKKDIDNCYEKTYGKEMDKDLYNSLAEFMYSDSITGGINTKTTYKTMNDKIKEAEINGEKINIVDNAPDGHEENQPK